MRQSRSQDSGHDRPVSPRLEPVVTESANLPKRIVERIRTLIATGQLKPGDRLPAERDLAADLNVSRTSLREALRALEALGLLDVRHGQGIFVQEIDPEAVSRRLAPIRLLNRQEVGELYQVRQVLDAKAAAWAAENATDQEVAELVQLVERMEAELSTGEGTLEYQDRAFELDTEFHTRIYQAAHNSVLLRVAASLMDLVQETRHANMAIPGRPRRSLQDHRRVAEAIAARNPQAAELAMRQHLEDIAHALAAAGLLEEEPSPRR